MHRNGRNPFILFSPHIGSQYGLLIFYPNKQKKTPDLAADALF